MPQPPPIRAVLDDNHRPFLVSNDSDVQSASGLLWGNVEERSAAGSRPDQMQIDVPRIPRQPVQSTAIAKIGHSKLYDCSIDNTACEVTRRGWCGAGDVLHRTPKRGLANNWNRCVELAHRKLVVPPEGFLFECALGGNCIPATATLIRRAGRNVCR
jgi:hypothetical protein